MGGKVHTQFSVLSVPFIFRTKGLACFGADPNHFGFKKRIVAHFLTGSSFSSRGSNL